MQLYRLLRASRRLVVGLPLACAVATGALTLLRDRTWTASASFTPQASRNSLAGLAGVAAQLGVSVPLSDPAQSPDFYASLVKSPQILVEVVDSPFVYVAPGGERRRGLLADVWEVKGGTPAERRAWTVRRLNSELRVTQELKTGVVRLTMRTKSPDLSAQVLARVLERVNVFNVARRQSTANNERQFVGARVRDAQRALRQAEDELEAFQNSNRGLLSSPQLLFDRDRLDREMRQRQQVYTTLLQAYEQANIEAVRNTPTITVIDRPEPPALPDSRLGLLKVLLASVVGFLLAAGWVVGRAVLRAADRSPDVPAGRDLVAAGPVGAARSA